ncbi:MAG: hypothetical protein QW663_01385 [Nitrososphaerota archaeon]
MNKPIKGLSFTFNTPPDPLHEINGIVRGLAPVLNGLALIGEGIGLGGVVGVLGRRTIFPLEAETWHIGITRIVRKLILNGLSVKYLSSICVNKPYKKLRALLSPFYLQSNVLRPLYFMLMAGSTLAGIKSRYVRDKTYGIVDLEYKLSGCEIDITVRRNTPKSMRVLVANELSGRLFTYIKLNGVKKRLSPWMSLGKGVVELVSPSLKLSMLLDRPDDVVTFAGREVLGRRLDWAGVSFELPKGENMLHYRVVFKRVV